MAIFESTEKMYDILGGFFQDIMNRKDVGPKFLKKKMVICWVVDGPDGEFRIAPGEDQSAEVICGESDLKPSVVVKLSGDVVHDFLLKKVGLTSAVAQGKIKVKGSLQKVMGVLALLGPAYEQYPEHAASHGLPVN